MRLLWLLGGLLLAACDGNSAHHIVTPDGHQGAVIECPTPAFCWEKASDMCPKGYAFVERNDKNGRVNLVTTPDAQVSTTKSHAHKETWVVICRDGTPRNVDDACLKDPLQRSNMELAADCTD